MRLTNGAVAASGAIRHENRGHSEQGGNLRCLRTGRCLHRRDGRGAMTNLCAGCHRPTPNARDWASGASNLWTIGLVRRWRSSSRVGAAPGDLVAHHLGDRLRVAAPVMGEGLRRADIPAVVERLGKDHEKAILVGRRHEAPPLRLAEHSGRGSAAVNGRPPGSAESPPASPARIRTSRRRWARRWPTR